MPSMHTDRAFQVARNKGAYSAHDLAIWNELMAMSKRELAEIALRLAGLCSDECDDPQSCIERLREERYALRENRII